MVLFGSHLRNAGSHNTKNMPLVLAGGGARSKLVIGTVALISRRPSAQKKSRQRVTSTALVESGGHGIRTHNRFLGI
jgi:hypothetical protein